MRLVKVKQLTANSKDEGFPTKFSFSQKIANKTFRFIYLSL